MGELNPISDWLDTVSVPIPGLIMVIELGVVEMVKSGDGIAANTDWYASTFPNPND